MTGCQNGQCYAISCDPGYTLQDGACKKVDTTCDSAALTFSIFARAPANTSPRSQQLRRSRKGLYVLAPWRARRLPERQVHLDVLPGGLQSRLRSVLTLLLLRLSYSPSVARRRLRKARPEPRSALEAQPQGERAKASLPGQERTGVPDHRLDVSCPLLSTLTGALTDEVAAAGPSRQRSNTISTPLPSSPASCSVPAATSVSTLNKLSIRAEAAPRRAKDSIARRFAAPPAWAAKPDAASYSPAGQAGSRPSAATSAFAYTRRAASRATRRRRSTPSDGTSSTAKSTSFTPTTLPNSRLPYSRTFSRPSVHTFA